MHWTIGRSICLSIGAAMLAVCAYFLIYAMRWDRKVDGWVTEAPPRVLLDPASTSEVSTTFHHSGYAAHGQQIVLRVLDASGAPMPEDTWPKRLSMALTIEPAGHPDDARVLQGPGSRFDLEPAMQDRPGRLLAYDRFGPEGDYTLRMSLAEPCPQAAGSRFEVSTHNFLCGCERLPAMFARIIGIAVGILGLFFAIPAGAMILTPPKPPKPSAEPS